MSKLSEPVRADFSAKVTLSTRERDGPIPTRVLVNDEQLIFATQETKMSVALADVFDVARDVPATKAPDATATLTLGFRRGEAKETATIECGAETLAKFQLVLYKVLFRGTTVTLKHTGDGASVVRRGEQASLDISSGGIVFDCEDGTIVLPREDIDGFKTTKTTPDRQSQEPTVIIYSRRDGQAVRTGVCLPSYRHMNLFGRYLQSNPDAGFESGGEAVASTVEVLLVDDDPADLEMIELLLKQREDRLELATATSAAGGLEALRDQSFDCVVSDYDMPGTDGVEFLQQVREVDPDLPFILFTGQGSEVVAKQALLSDVTDYVEKGIGTQQYEILATRIRKALR